MMQRRTHPFMVKMGDFLPEYEILEKGRAPLAGSQAVLVRNGSASVTRKVDVGIIDGELR
jgi:hypothetical protein